MEAERRALLTMYATIQVSMLRCIAMTPVSLREASLPVMEMIMGRGDWSVRKASSFEF